MIKEIFSRLLFLLLRLISLFPFFILDAVGYLIYFLLNTIIRYREKVIMKNLKNSFAEKHESDLRDIKKKFYSYFSRLIVENIKMVNFSLNRLGKHIKTENPEILTEYYKQGKDIAVMAAHYGNWEWLLGLRKDIPHHTIAIYKSLNNKYFNDLFKDHRSRFGTELVNMREVPRVLLEHAENKRRTLTVFIADQSPVWEEIQYWTKFLKQDTPVYLGPEKLARKMKMAMVYFRVKVEKNHHYSVEIIPICDDASKTEEYKITERYFELLEEDISNAPEFWLWSHRRWKLTEKRNRLEKQGIFRFEGQMRKKTSC
ncbi:MAG: lysophospholipid acyltransferase family protein [Bacteroidota bacterium]